jgi:hypothetical protein
MELVCAWCGKTFGEDENEPNTVEVFGKVVKNVSHGMCPDCYEEEQIKLKKLMDEKNDNSK